MPHLCGDELYRCRTQHSVLFSTLSEDQGPDTGLLDPARSIRQINMKAIVPKPSGVDARHLSTVSSPPLRTQKIKGGNLQYRALLEAAPDAMVIVNDAGEIVLLNLRAEKQFGYHRDELLGQMVKNIIPEGFAERLVADGLRSAAEALAQQIGTGIELTGRRKDGSEFPIEIMLSPFESAEGILVTAAIRDITVRKDSEKHLAQMEGRYRGLLEWCSGSTPWWW